MKRRRQTNAYKKLNAAGYSALFRRSSPIELATLQNLVMLVEWKGADHTWDKLSDLLAGEFGL